MSFGNFVHCLIFFHAPCTSSITNNIGMFVKKDVTFEEIKL